MKLMALIMLSGLAFGSLGCQERVVGTQNDWVGSQYRPSPIDQEPEDEKGLGESIGDGLQDTGDFLFGWTGLTGNKRDSNQIRVIEMSEEHR